MVHDGASAGPQPNQPQFCFTTWEGNTGRLTLPVRLAEGAWLRAGGLGPGWLELTTDPEAPVLPYAVAVLSAGRVSVELKDAQTRLSFLPGERVLAHAMAVPRGLFIRVVAVDCLDTALREPTLRPPRLLMRPDWPLWRREVLGDG